MGGMRCQAGLCANCGASILHAYISQIIVSVVTRILSKENVDIYLFTLSTEHLCGRLCN